ncbi:choice-of-anchor I family protein [bacterium]|nr:choice-of-anchor I family protein [bacterium]
MYYLLLALLFTAASSFAGLKLDLIGVYHTGVYGQSAAEISAYDAATQRLFFTNANIGEVEILDLHDPAHPLKIGHIQAEPYGAEINSIAIHNSLVAVAIEPRPKTDSGTVAFFDTGGGYIHHLPVGALPDMLAFTPDGRYILTCNEGEPNDDYSIDPEGGISVIDISQGIKHAVGATASFTKFNSQEADLREQGVLIYGPNASVAQDIEPEYLAISSDSKTAFVTLQENNALAIVDIPSASIKSIVPLGFKNFSTPGNGFDPSDEDGGIHINNWPVFGIYSPDAIGAYEFEGKTYLVMANEGDSRDYEGFSESVRLRKALPLDSIAFPHASELLKEDALGRLFISSHLGDADHDGDLDAIYAFGGRSFSIRDSAGLLIFDSGGEFERGLAGLLPAQFNADHEISQSFDKRSDNKGCEPEGLALGKIKGRTYAFIGLERTGGVMVYDITDPRAASFVTYKTSRNFNHVLPNEPTRADMEAVVELGPEGLLFIPASESPTHFPLLVVCNEVSGSVTIYSIQATE